MKQMDRTTTFAAGLILFLTPLTMTGRGDEGLDADVNEGGVKGPTVAADPEANDEFKK